MMNRTDGQPRAREGRALSADSNRNSHSNGTPCAPRCECSRTLSLETGSSPFFFEDFIYLFPERRMKERERNTNVWLPRARPLLGTWPATQAGALTGNRTSDPLVQELILNPLSHTSRGTCFPLYRWNTTRSGDMPKVTLPAK